MKYGKIIKGNIKITKDCKDDFSKVEKITGDVSIYSNAKLEAPLLESVGGYVSIDSNAKLEALKSVGGYVYIHSNAKLEAPLLESVGGDVYIDSNAKLEAPLLESVGGDVSIHSNAKLEALKSVGGYVSIYSNAKLEAPLLESVGGYVSIYSNAKLEAPLLESVGGDVSIDSNAKLEASKDIKKSDKNCTAKNTRKFALEFNFNCFLKLGYLFADGILSKILSKHTNKNGMTVYKVQIIGHLKTSYCVEIMNQDGTKTFAHGETIGQAKKDLKYKFANIDTSIYENYTLDTIVSFKDAIQMYHDITGACSLGTKHFCENVLKVKKKKYSIKECIELTEGQYNSDKFKDFFNK